MSIAIITSPANAISNLTDLVTEVRDEMDDDAYPADKIYRAIGRAEAAFNRELRVPKMETEAILDITTEETDLPNDFLQMRRIYAEGSPDQPVTTLSPGTLRSTYQGVSGTPAAYAIENRRIIVGPVGAFQAKVLYYARIPALTEDNPTNWLLDEHPDVYLHYVLSVLFNNTGDRERSAVNLSIARDLIAQINDSGMKNRWGAGPLVPTGLRQVRGARI